MRRKGIFCIEGLWDHDDIKDKSTVTPILDILDKRGDCRYIYHNCATREELVFFLDKWKQKKISDRYPILYLAFHGEEEKICLNSNDKVTLDELSEVLEGSCYGKVIYFGSCLTLGTHGSRIQTFLKKTKAIAAIGYKQDIDWLISTACDLLIFEALLYEKFDNIGIKNIIRKVFNNYGRLPQELNLRIVVNRYLSFPRKRKL